MKIRKKKQDIIFSSLIRERANYCCQACGVNKRFEPATLDCCHIMGRRSLALRWHPSNALAMCRKDHIFYTEHPFDFRDFCIDHFGEDLIAELRLVSNNPVKWSDSVREDIYKHYQKELKKMEKERLTTELMIDFEAHEIMYTFVEKEQVLTECPKCGDKSFTPNRWCVSEHCEPDHDEHGG